MGGGMIDDKSICPPVAGKGPEVQKGHAVTGTPGNSNTIVHTPKREVSLNSVFRLILSLQKKEY